MVHPAGRHNDLPVVPQLLPIIDGTLAARSRMTPLRRLSWSLFFQRTFTVYQELVSRLLSVMDHAVSGVVPDSESLSSRSQSTESLKEGSVFRGYGPWWRGRCAKGSKGHLAFEFHESGLTSGRNIQVVCARAGPAGVAKLRDAGIETTHALMGQFLKLRAPKMSPMVGSTAP